MEQSEPGIMFFKQNYGNKITIIIIIIITRIKDSIEIIQLEDNSHK